MQQPPEGSQTSSTAPIGGSGSTSKGQFHVKLIQARALHVKSTAKPYVVVQFEQNEFVSRDPIDEADKEVKGTAVPTSSAMSALGALGSKAAAAEASRRGSKGSNKSSNSSPASSVPSASALSNGGGLFGRISAHNPVWKHEVSFDVTPEPSRIIDVYDLGSGVDHTFLGNVKIKPQPSRRQVWMRTSSISSTPPTTTSTNTAMLEMPSLQIVSPRPRAFAFPTTDDFADSPYATPSSSPFEPDLGALALSSSPGRLSAFACMSSPVPLLVSSSSSFRSTTSSSSACPSSLAFTSPSLPSRKKSVAGADIEERRPNRGGDDYVKRFENAFSLFRRNYCKSVAPVKDAGEGGHAGGNGIAEKRRPAYYSIKTVIEQWNALPPEERAKWEGLAREKKREHEALHGGYVYRPVRWGRKNSAVPSAISPTSSVPAPAVSVASTTPPPAQATEARFWRRKHLAPPAQIEFVVAAPRLQHGGSASTPAHPHQPVHIPNVYAGCAGAGEFASSQTGGYIDTLLASWERRLSLLSMTVPEADGQRPFSTQVSESLGHICTQIGTLLVQILNSRDARHAAQRLERDRAQSFVDAIQNTLDQGTLPDSNSRSKARQLMQKVSETVEQLPSSLFITGVNDRDEYPTCGGGFSDIYQASYQGKAVALKRLRIFTADSTPHRTRLQFCKEALVWQGLRHRFILPLLGIDRSTFAPSFCMVSPWMKYGTVLRYLRDHGCGDVNRLLLEIAQGLDYLHSMDVVHGDLRGTNILISDDRNACLSDFGLATSIDSTTAGVTSSSNRAGSVRWFAPELIDPTKFECPKFVRTKASDVYAYACVCLELYTRNPPFSHLREIAASLRVIQGERPEQPPAMPAALWQLVTAAWAQDFLARPSVHDIAIALEGLS